MSLLRRPVWLIVLFCLGCSAQNPTADLNKRIERQVRSHYNVPGHVAITVEGRKPSEFPGYDLVQVVFTEGKNRVSNDFLLAQDGNTLIRMTKLDLRVDPYESVMKKISLAGRAVRGNPEAKVTVVVFDDFQCPFCARFHQALFREVFNEYKDRIKVMYKDYPLFEIHPWAGRAANNANCLAELNNDAFWDFADAVHFNPVQVDGTPAQRRGLPEKLAALDVLAYQLGAARGVDPDKLKACVKAQGGKPMQDSVREAESLGISATPTVFVNGRRIEGAADAAELRAILNAALRDAGVPVPNVPPPAPKATQTAPASPPQPAPAPANK